MSISGNLRTMPFADLLQWVAQSRKTGTLVVDGPRFQKKVYFQDGSITASASDNPKEFLSYYLVGWGILSDEELEHMFQLQERHGTMLGELLVMIGRVTRDELDRILTVKTEETVYDLFLWDEGEFRFLDNILPSRKFQALHLAVDMLILEGVRRRDEWSRIREVVPDIRHIPRVVRALDVNRMGPLEIAILREIDGTNSIEQIALNCRIASFHVLHFVFQGVKNGVFEIEPPTSEPERIPGLGQASWRLLIKEVERAVGQGELLEGYRRLLQLESKYGDQRQARELAEGIRREIEAALEGIGLDDRAVPELAVSMAELTSVECAPEEGFVLSRINGIYTLGEILKLVPGDPVEKRLLVKGLLDRGLLRLKPPS